MNLVISLKNSSSIMASNSTMFNPSINSTNVSVTTHTEPYDAEQDPGDIGFMMLSSVLLWISIPGCGFFYSGMGRSTGALTMIILSFWSTVLVSIQWLLFGYSITFTNTNNPLFGNFDKVLLLGMNSSAFPTAPQIPEIAFCLYQAVTATLPTALLTGALAERARVLPALIFMLVWTTFAYNPIAYWTLNNSGWGFKLGVQDFGGGAPVHVPAGAAALVYSYFLGPRLKADIFAQPHNMLSLTVGTTLIWFAAFGYNAGSAFASTVQAITACVVTNVAGSAGAMTWALLDYWTYKNLSGFGLCAGAVVGLISVTPGSGFVAPWAGLAYGIVGSVVCRVGHQIRGQFSQFDDSLDVFAMHGLAGIVGMVLTGMFSQIAYGGAEVRRGGWIEGNWLQVPIQCADIVTGFIWSSTVSIITLYVMNRIPGLELRIDSNTEQIGLDVVEMGVSCYEHVDELKMNSIQTITDITVSGNIKDPKFTKDVNELNENNGKLAKSVTNVEQDPPIVGNNWRSYWT